MKKILLSLSTILLLAFTACKKDPKPPVIEPVPVPISTDDTAKVLLKSIVATNLPNPYFHFKYDAGKYVTDINFADGFELYQAAYENKKLKKLTNIRNNNVLNYKYSNGLVRSIAEISGVSNRKIWNYAFEYNSNNQLVLVKWYFFPANSNDSILDRKVVLSYHTDGNLASMDDYRSDQNDQLQWSSTHTYGGYDDGTNVDDFAMMKDFMETLIYLPSVKLQKNNPRNELIIGTQNDFHITYSYQYSNKLPQRKTGTMVQTRGGGTGQPFIFTEQFTYY